MRNYRSCEYLFVDIAYIPLNLEYNERESLVNFLFV